MNENMRNWLTALRSGVYTQGSCNMKAAAPDGQGWEWCCLGVLCDRFDPTLWAEEPIPGTGGYTYNTGDSTDLAHYYPPQSVLEWAGLSEEQAHDLAYKNDSGWSFDQIADYVENGFQVPEDVMLP